MWLSRSAFSALPEKIKVKDNCHKDSHFDKMLLMECGDRTFLVEVVVEFHGA